MKINRNQKSVLTLFLFFFFGTLMGHGDVFSIYTVVLWIILGCWFYGVRDKPKSEQEKSVDKPGIR